MRSIVIILLFFACAVGKGYSQKPVVAQSDVQQSTIVKFYPNPAVNFITFEIKEPVERGTVLQVYSFLGRQVGTVPVNAQRVTLNLSEFFRGVYVFQLRAPSGKVLETNKFQVSK